jgi:uncharacterized membrane protein YukC
MVTFNEMQVQEIMQDENLSREEKIERLKAIEAEARDLQRTASESPMNADDGWEADLREVRLALEKLGAEQSRKGAASL